MAVDIAISGACGKMGRAVADAALADGGFRICAAIESSASAELGRPLYGVRVSDKLAASVGALVDFSAPAGTMARLDECVKLRSGLVVGTTGLDDDHRRRLQAASSEIPILVSSNMSVGVNVLLKIIPEVVRLLGDGFDIEIVEAHHRGKKDAPSGTALSLALELARASKRELDKAAVYGRHGPETRRRPEEIGIHAVRAGGVVGEHRILFVSDGEQVELAHTAFTRAVFAQGAIRAAKFVASAKPGFYAMTHALGV